MKTEPVVCTLNSEDLKRYASDLLPGLFAVAQDVDWKRDGVRLTFGDETDLLPRIAQVVERERKCCRFFQFRIDVPPGLGAIGLEITGPPGTREILASLPGIGSDGTSQSALNQRSAR